MPAAARRWTAAEVRQLIEESPEYCPRHELIDGELLVTPAPAPRHQIALAWLFAKLEPYLRREQLGTVLWSPSDIELAPEQLTQPDLFVVPQQPHEVPRSWAQITELLLVVEALSPSTARNDRNKKRPHFQRSGVPECWLIDVDAQRIERWRPHSATPELLHATVAWRPALASAPLIIELDELWRVTAP